jgi:hypothetical protein
VALLREVVERVVAVRELNSVAGFQCKYPPLARGGGFGVSVDEREELGRTVLKCRVETVERLARVHAATALMIDSSM